MSGAARYGCCCGNPALSAQAARGRIDRVLQIDGGPPLGIEIKATPTHCSTIGEYFAQAQSYSAGQIAPAAASVIPRLWCGRPLHAVFVAFDTEPLRQSPYTHVGRHATAAERLFGPAKVGFVDSRALRLGELRLRLCASGFWSLHHGYNQSTIHQRPRLGSGNN